MTSSIFSFSPLLADILQRPTRYAIAASKLCLLLYVVMVVDRAGDAFLYRGLRKYFALGRDCPVVCIGHSRTVLGLDAELLEKELKVRVAKYAVQGANVKDRLAMIRHCVACSKVPVDVVIYDVSGYTFDDEGLSSNSYELFLPFLAEPEMGPYVARNCPSRIELALCRILRLHRYNETTLALSMRGHLGMHSSLKENQVDLNLVAHRIRNGNVQQHRVHPNGRAAFQETVDFLGTRNIRLILAYLPTIDLLNDVSRKAHDEIVNRFRDIAEEHEHVIFFDYNKDFESRYDLFADGIHLNQAGQQIVTMQLADDIRPLIKADRPMLLSK